MSTENSGSGTPEPVATVSTTTTTATPDPATGGETTEPVRLGPVVEEEHILRAAAPLEAGIRAEEALKEAEEWEPRPRVRRWVRVTGMILAGIVLVSGIMAAGFFIRPTIYGWMDREDPAVERRAESEAEVEAAQAAKTEAESKMAVAEARASELAAAADKATADAQAIGIELATTKAELETAKAELEAATPTPDPAPATATVNPMPQVLSASVQYVKDPNGGYAYEYVPPADSALPECELVGRSKPQDFQVQCGDSTYRCLKSGMNSLTLLATCTKQ